MCLIYNSILTGTFGFRLKNSFLFSTNTKLTKIHPISTLQASNSYLSSPQLRYWKFTWKIIHLLSTKMFSSCKEVFAVVFDNDKLWESRLQFGSASIFVWKSNPYFFYCSFDSSWYSSFLLILSRIKSQFMTSKWIFSACFEFMSSRTFFNLFAHTMWRHYRVSQLSYKHGF